MVHLTCSSRGGGTLLKPYFVPHRQTITGEIYANMLEGDVLRQIEAEMGGSPFYFQHDLASPHTSKTVEALLRNEGIAIAPWIPSGADLTPHGHLCEQRCEGSSARQGREID